MKKVLLSLALIAVVLMSPSASRSAGVPKVLPDPDGKPADMTRPLKIYILAGQSNMVGFGRYNGARNPYASIFAMADPDSPSSDVVIGRTRYGMSKLGVYVSKEANAAEGGTASLYAGAYDASKDYDKVKATRTSPVSLGSAKTELPVKGGETCVVRAYVEVPDSGTYTASAGMHDSANCVITLDGKQVYSKKPGESAVRETMKLEKGKRYPVKITYMKGGSAAFWMTQSELIANGDLELVTKRDGKFPWLTDKEGKWTACKDATYADVRTGGETGRWEPLKVTSNGKHIGPEVPFGYVMAAYHDEHVLLIESSMGNRALSFDFRPPSSGKTAEEEESKWCGLEYDLMVKGVHMILGKLDEVVPGYKKDQGYEIVGFAWWQGHKDKGRSKEEYEKHLVNMIKDLRKEFKAPEMKAVVATVGFHGKNLPEGWHGVHAAQMAVGDPKQHPEFAGQVKSVDTRPFWRNFRMSPTGTDYHYNHNAETYVLTGDALGRAMVDLLEAKK